MDREFPCIDLVTAARKLGRRELSPVALIEEALDHIARRNDELGIFITPLPDTARQRARAAEEEIGSGEYRGALHGIPVAVKDLFSVEGVRLTAGSRVLDGFVAERDAPIVARLREAGAILVGTTALDEFAFATVGEGIVNPAAPTQSVGGSSGGSAAAVAAGMALATLGTDTGGSVRIPATCCGVVGFKPSFGVLSTEGVVPLAWSNDHVGILARTVPDVASVFGELTGGHWSGERELAGVRIGIPEAEFLGVACEEIRTRHERDVEALVGLGADITEVDIPDSSVGLSLQYLIVLPEAAAYHFGRHGDRLERYGEGVRAALEWGSSVQAIEYIDAKRVRTAMKRRIDHLFDQVEFLVLPTMPIVPPGVGTDEVRLGDGSHEDVVSAMLRYTCLFNHTGHPAIAVPDRGGDRPIHGAQFVGRRGCDIQLLGAAASFQRLTC